MCARRAKDGDRGQGGGADQEVGRIFDGMDREVFSQGVRGEQRPK